MASNYNSLGFNLMTTGENAGTWGTNTNLNLNYLRDTFGYISIAMTSDRTLTIPDNSTGTYDGRAFIIELTGTLGGTRVLDIAATAGSGSSPGGSASILKPFIVFDNTTHSGDTLTFKVTGATGFALSEGTTYLCYHNGTDIINTGLGSGDVTLTGTQTLTNKTLTSPKINEDVVCSSTATELNLLDGCTSTTTELNYNDLTTLGTSAGSKVLSADSNNLTKITGAAYFEEDTLTFDATQDWDVRASPVAKVTLTANVIFDAPSNPTTGQFISILCIQDAGGSNTIGWNAVFEFAADTAPTATTTGDQGDLFSFRYNGAKWLEVGRTLNLTVA
jgi:hypothetical protein